MKKFYLVSLAGLFFCHMSFAADQQSGKRKPSAAKEYATVSESEVSTRTEKKFGLGVMAGEPTGINMKVYTSEKNAVDAGLAWSFGSENAFHVHSDYLFHNSSLFKLQDRPLQFFFGAGGRLKFEKRTKFGIRIPVGLAYNFEEQPIDAFFEVAPIVDLAPSTDLSINLSVGARYYF